MAILLKTTLVRVSSIQIMQVRVQNKGKSVWKSRYDGDVSCDVFVVLVLFVLALVPGCDLLRRVLPILRVQPEPVGRHFSALLIQLGGENGGVGVLGDSRRALGERTAHRCQLWCGLLPEGG